MIPGTRVTVKIAEPATWATGAPECLNGATGVIERVTDKGACLVRFDAPVRSWHANSAPKAAFHFGREDLVAI